MSQDFYFPVTSPDLLTIESMPEGYPVFYRTQQGAPLYLIAPADGIVYMVPIHQPGEPVFTLICYEPMGGVYPRYRGWLAPAPTIIGFAQYPLSFSEGDQIDVTTRLLTAYRDNYGPQLPIGGFEDDHCVTFELAEVSERITESAQLFYERFWAAGNYQGIPVRQQQVIHEVPAMEGASQVVLVYLAHVETQEDRRRFDRPIYVFDAHEYFQRLTDHDLLAGSIVTGFPYSHRTDEARERALAAPFLINRLDSPPADLARAMTRLIGGLQRVRLEQPPLAGDTIPLEILYVTQAEPPSTAILEGFLPEGETARWAVSWHDEEVPTLNGETELEAGSNQAELAWEDIGYTWGNRADPLKIRLKAGDHGPFLFAQRNLMPIIQHQAERILEEKGDLINWLWEAGPYSPLPDAGGLTVSNREKLHLFNLIQAVLTDPGVSRDRRETLRGYLTDRFREFRDRMSSYETRLNNLTSGPITGREGGADVSLRTLVFDRPYFRDQLLANPSVENLETLSKVMDALAETPEGQQDLTQGFGQFFPDDSLPTAGDEPFLTFDWFADTWRRTFARHRPLSEILFKIYKIGLLHRMTSLSRQEAWDSIRRIQTRFETLFGRLGVRVTQVDIVRLPGAVPGADGVILTIEEFEYFQEETSVAQRMGTSGVGVLQRADDVLYILNMMGKTVDLIVKGYRLADDPGGDTFLEFGLSASNYTLGVTTNVLGFKYINDIVSTAARREAEVAAGASGALVLQPAVTLLGAASGVNDVRKAVNAAAGYHARGDDLAANLMGVAALGSFIGTVGTVVGTTGLGAPVGVALIGLGVVLNLIGSISAAAFASGPLELALRHSYFGDLYVDTARPDHGLHDWWQNVPRQISELYTLFYPIEGSFVLRESNLYELTFTPGVAQEGSRVFFEMKGRTLTVGSLFNIDLSSGTSATGLPAGSLGRYRATREPVTGRITIHIFVVFRADDLERARVVVSAEPVPDGLMEADFINRYAPTTRGEFTVERE
jgi:hypothetical protein